MTADAAAGIDGAAAEDGAAAAAGVDEVAAIRIQSADIAYRVSARASGQRLISALAGSLATDSLEFAVQQLHVHSRHSACKHTRTLVRSTTIAPRANTETRARPQQLRAACDNCFTGDAFELSVHTPRCHRTD